MTSTRPRPILALLLAATGILGGCGGSDSRFDVLVFSRTTAFRHADAIEAGRAALEAIGADRGFAVESRERLGDLDGVEVVVLLNTNGEGVIRGAERAEFERWVRDGGGVVAIHAAANADRDWPWYGELLGGARFRNHPAGDLQLQRAAVVVDDPGHAATEAVPRRWTRTDEWYNLAPEPGPDAHVLLSLDERTYAEQDGTPAADDHPIAWTVRLERGRALYTALGHGAAAWDEPHYRSHILGALEWAAAD